MVDLGARYAPAIPSIFASGVPESCDRLTNALTVLPLREYVRAAAESLQVHPDFALLNALCVVNTAVNGKLCIVRGQHREVVQLYIMPIVDPGERKSAVVNLAREPILAAITRTTRRIYVDDVTPTALKQALADAGGHLVVHTAEGSTMMGIMSRGGFTKGVFCAAYDGEDVHLDRANKDPIDIPDASMTLCLACQPSVAWAFARKQDVARQGLLGRFLMAVFPRLAGARDVHTERIAESTIAAYTSIVRRLFEIKPRPDGRRHTLTLSSAAEARFVEFHEQVEKELRSGGLLAFDPEWGSKLHGKVLRLAALLHCAAEDAPVETPIGLESVEQAIRMANVFAEYAREFYAIARDEIEDCARQIYSLAKRWATGELMRPSGSLMGEFSSQDIRNTLVGLSNREIDAGIERLLQTGRITENLNFFASQYQIPRRGRKSAARYAVVGCMPLQAMPQLPFRG